MVGVSEVEIRMQTALGARVSATSMCHVRDVVLLLWEGSLRAGVIWSLVDVYGIHLALIALWDPVDRDVVRFFLPDGPSPSKMLLSFLLEILWLLLYMRDTAT